MFQLLYASTNEKKLLILSKNIDYLATMYQKLF